MIYGFLRQTDWKCLIGNRARQYSIRINEQWWICFEWCDGDVMNVEAEDKLADRLKVEVRKHAIAQ